MDVKFYIKRNINNQIAKVTKSNILFLNEQFNSEINVADLITILRRVDDKNLGDFFENSKYGRIPLSARLVKKFTLCKLYEFKCLSKDEFIALTPIERKFEFIISQKTVSWILLLDKSEVVGFLKFCNIHCEESSARLVQLRELAKSAIKTFRGGLLDTEDNDNFNDSSADLTFTENKLPLELDKSQKQFYEKNNSEPDLPRLGLENKNTDTVETGDVAQQLKDLLINIEQTLSPNKNIEQSDNLKLESEEVNQNINLNADLKIINNNTKEIRYLQSLRDKIDTKSEIYSNIKTVDNTNTLTSKNKMARPQQLSQIFLTVRAMNAF